VEWDPETVVEFDQEWEISREHWSETETVVH